MRVEDQTYQLIEDYLNGNLSAGDLSAFEKELQGNSELQQKVKLQRFANELVVENRLLQVKDILQQQKISGQKPVWKYIAGAIVAALLLTAIVVFKNYDKPDKQASDSVVKSTDPVAKINSEEEKQASQKETDDLSDERRSDKPVSESLITSNEEKTMTSDSGSVYEAVKTEKKVEKSPEEKTADTSLLDPCTNIYITASVFTNGACPGDNDGSIVITKIKGGKSPYSIYIYNSNSELQNTHAELLAGTYNVEIKDGKGCSKKIANLIVPEKACKKDYSFNPFMGESWSIPSSSQQGRLLVYNESGNVYFDKEINAGSEEQWSGESKNGELNIGYYIFVIKYNDGTQVQGSITIVR